MRKLTVLSVCVALLFCLSFSSSVIASDEEEILQLQENFLKANSTGDYALMSTLYWHSPKTSTFAPGNPPILLQGWDQSIAKYWKSSSVSPGETTTITSTLFLHPKVTFLKDDVAVVNGYEYFVETDTKTQEQTTATIRITRIVQKIGGKWLIVNDHASMLPSE